VQAAAAPQIKPSRVEREPRLEVVMVRPCSLYNSTLLILAL